MKKNELDKLKEWLDKPVLSFLMNSENIQNDLNFLLISGSFNPIHAFHVKLMEIIKSHLGTLGKQVLCGFIVPSSDEYLASKLSNGLIPLKERVKLCRISTNGLDWMYVCDWGELSSNRIRLRIEEIISTNFLHLIHNRKVSGIEIMGSDTVVRIFGKIIKNPGDIRYNNRQIYCVIRHSQMREKERRILIEEIIPESKLLGANIHLFELPNIKGPLSRVSSTKIRELILDEKWDELESFGFLHPKVFQLIKTT